MAVMSKEASSCARLIQRLDVAERVRELVAGDADFVGGQPVKHEGVVGVGAVGDGDFDGLGRNGN